MELKENVLPWNGRADWKQYDVEGLKDATDEWLDLVFGAFADDGHSGDQNQEG